MLDTHVLIWMTSGDPRLGREARHTIDDGLAHDSLAVSAISFWETALLVGKQRLRLPQPVDAWREKLLKLGLVEIPLDGRIGINAVQLSDLHPDPADRIIAATASLRKLTLLTADERLLAWTGPLLLQDARR